MFELGACNHIDFVVERMEVEVCSEPGLSLERYGVDLFLPCSIHFDEKDDAWVLELVRDAYKAGREADKRME